MLPLGVYIEMPADEFGPGDTCYVNAIVSNDTEDSYTTVPLFVVLEVYGQFWFWPSWNMSLDYQEIDLDALTVVTYPIVPEFVWPDDGGSASDIYFYGAMLNSDWTDVMGHMDMFRFSYYQ